MKEHPILFSGEMVRAILDGRKTQTRRVVKPNMRGTIGIQLRNIGGNNLWPYNWHDDEHNCGMDEIPIPCPYGQPGDRLWVREAWGKVRMRHLMSTTPGRVEEAVTYRAGRRVWNSKDRPESGSFDNWPLSWSDDYPPSDGRWRPSIHMPRWASRITLEIISVRVERLQEISDSDAQAEGIRPYGDSDRLWARGPLAGDQNIVDCTGFPKLAFRSIWESINGPDSWGINPWVWVVEFRRVEQESAAA